ncbi:MAG: class I SAM-dependent rRNA methyltransferase [Myxococcales bacterium]|nr:class I SAM-dependent rRNA methyltransferase [Myxococcales bacterium]
MPPTVTITPGALARLLGGHPWVRRADVVRGPDAAGDIVRVSDGRRDGGTALWSERSRIALRLVAREAVAPNEIEALIDRRIGEAIDRRRAFVSSWDACRVVHGEADLLPGLFVDRYADVAVIQTAATAMDAREEAIAAIVARRLGARLVVARDDGAARDFEELPRRSGVLRGTGPTLVAWHDAGSAMETDVLTDGKTGGFLDQQENHARAASCVEGAPEALDAFTYHGGFALALARAGARVTALDESPVAIDRARKNATLNGVALTARCANAFDALRELEGEGKRFDLVVIDPPALAKRASALPAAERGYKELNLRALRLLRPNGVLITCSCSGRLTRDRFASVVEAAARDVGRPLQLVEQRGAGRDHPSLVGVPETEYLKCWILRALS